MEDRTMGRGGGGKRAAGTTGGWPARIVAVALLAALVSGCELTDPEAQPDPETWHALGEGTSRSGELERHRRAWESARPAAYSYVVARQCFCPTEIVRPVRVEVRSGTIRSLTYVETGTAVPEAWRELFPTIDDLFDLLEEAVERRAEEMRVSWDATRDYPTRIWIDYDDRIADEEVGFTAVELTPLP